ncbi:MAG TPA: hypothetical protein VHV55_18270 [Pirellulales bacterium]|jgi:hypothetical protein|nr:hypothetical protein [Pirellulales bacterium]
MNIIGKILIGLILIATCGFLYLAAAMLSAEGSWQKVVVQKQKDLDQSLAAKKLVEHGGERAKLAVYRIEDGLPKPTADDPADQLGLDQYKLVLNALIIDKGRVWQARRGQVTPTGDVSLQIEKPTPAAIKDKAMLYAFESKGIQDGGAYMGEFKVTAPAGQNVTLVPAVRLSPAELARLAQSDSAWLLYEVMPLDRTWTFAGMTDEQLTTMLPESIRAEFLHAGKDKDYQRPLRAYTVAFRDVRNSIALTLDEIAARTVDLGHLKQSVDGITAQVQARDAEIVTLQAELKRSSAEQDKIAEQVSAFEAKVAALQDQTAKLLADNKRLAARLAAAEWQALRRVEQLSRAPQATP